MTYNINFAKLNIVGRGSQHYTLQLNILYLWFNKIVKTNSLSLMNDMDIKSGIETNTYLHSNYSHKGVVCVKVCVGFSARLLFCHFAFEIYKILERRS